MKISQFSSTISLTKMYNLIYNSYSDSFIILSKNSTILNNPELLKKIDLQLYEKLINAHFFIDEKVDEIALVKEMQQKVDHDSSQYNLIINPTLDCNFKCWYCYESKVPKSRVSDETKERIKKLIDNTIYNQKELKWFSLNFFGGEPFLNYPLVKDIIQYTTTTCANNPKKIHLSISFTTNGYLLNEKIIEELSNYNVSYLQITLDGNREQHNKVRYASIKEGSYDKILRNVKLLLNKSIGVVLRINYTSDNISNITDVVEDLCDIDPKIRPKLDIQFHRVWQDSVGPNIDKEVEAIINSSRKKGFITYKFPLNNVKSPCYADKMNGALINFNGDIFRCTALNFSQQKRDGYLDELGSIIWEDDAYNMRKNAKFKNKPCLNCRILPICNGGCSQKAIEYKDKDYCIFGFDEKNKDKAILDKFRYYLEYYPNFVLTLKGNLK